MSSTQFQFAGEYLANHYGRLPLPARPGTWEGICQLLLDRRARGKQGRRAESTNAFSVQTAGEIAAISSTELQEILESSGQNPKLAGSLIALARWWEEHTADTGTFDGQSLEQLQAELREIPGVNIELADRILLFVCSLPVYPLDRGSIRVACRHGWQGIEADYDEWQDFFRGGLTQAGVELEQFSLGMARIGKDFCGPEPRCETCPLRPLLPEQGPYNPD